MITNKKQKQLLKEQEERLRKEYEEECNEYRATICKLEEYIHDLEEYIHDLKDIQLKADLEDNLKHYDYAILVKDFKTLLWHDGRWENHYKKFEFTTNDYDEVPELTIIK